MAYTLYGRVGSGSSACEALLALSGLNYRLVDVIKNEDGTTPADFLAINPLGQVPALVTPEGTVITESAAIMLYLADLVPEKRLAPAINDPQRGPYLRWMVYLDANIYMSDLRRFYAERYTMDAGGAAGVRAAAIDRLKTEWATVVSALGKGPFLLGDRMSAADIYLAMFVSWMDDFGRPFMQSHPAVGELCRKIAGLPSVVPVWQRHEIEV